jgi:hypothetical protein
MRRSVWLVQQGVWDVPRESMPLGVGYLKAAAYADETIRREMDIRIFNFKGGDSAMTMAVTMFREGAPDLMGFSVWGWNYRAFGDLAESFKQINPRGWVVFGGTHVANQARRVLRALPAVDLVVNSEGEFVFRDILRAYLGGRRLSDLDDVPGISLRREPGTVVTTPAAARIQDLDSIPSPFLTGAIPLTDGDGEFRYDVALMETSRGCPYQCAFCYWGGATGQKIRAFPRDRLRDELEVFARHRVHSVVLCDSNFGMLARDAEFVEDVVRIRERYGYPRAIEASWAKNKSKTFYEIVRRMKDEGMRSSFTLSLQTLDPTALELMQRRNMRLNEWEGLVRWLYQEGLDLYAELIWGAPGETVQSFLEGYDRLSRFVTRIAVYPLLLLPNTEYAESRERYGFVTVRGEHDDFEHVLAHGTMSIADNLEMQHFVLWARTLAEHLVLRHLWVPLRELAGLTQSGLIRSLIRWLASSSHPAAARLLALAGGVRHQASGLPTFVRELYGEPALDELLAGWWEEAIVPRLPAEHLDFLSEVFRYDCLSRPVFDPPGVRLDLPVVEIAGETYYCRAALRFAYDVPTLLARFARGETGEIERRPTEVSLYLKVGFHEYYATSEAGVYFAGRTRAEILEPAAAPALAAAGR